MYTQRREGERELGRDFSLDCYLGDDAWLSKPDASNVRVESVFFCHHCKWLLAPESDFSIISLGSSMVFVIHLFGSSLARSSLLFFVPVSSSGGSYLLMDHVCRELSGSAGLNPRFTMLSTWDFEVLTCLVQDFISFLVNSTLGPAYKFLMILSFSARSVQFSSKPVW